MKHARNLLALVVIHCGLLSQLARAAEVVWIPAGDTWRFFRGAREASAPDTAAWRAPGFADGAWETGRLPLYYGEPLVGTPITDMQANYSTLFLRRSFVVGNPADVSALVLRAMVDDGFIAWINGVEVARIGAPDGEPRFDSLASVNAAEPVQMTDYPVANPQAALRPGVNVLAVQVFNVNLASSDIVIDAALSATPDTDPPFLARLQPVDGAVVRQLDSVEVLFSEPVRGVDAADLLLDGVPATGVLRLAPEQYLFTFPGRTSGTVQCRIPPGSGITDLSGGALPFSGAAWRYTVNASAPAPGVGISEFLASNERGIRDEDGDTSDWIEILNGSATTVSLAGWALEDGSNRWRFPPVSLAANARLVVWASGKDRTNAAAPLHTNFRLNADGEHLALLGPSGAVIQQYAPAYPPQRPDVSYGHAEGAPTLRGYFTTPTPGAPNSLRGDGFAPDVEFSVPGGTYPAGVLELALRPGTNAPGVSNVVIRYTLDGSLPTGTSSAYTNTLSFTNLSVQVRARAFAADLLPGTIRSESYFPIAASVAGFRSDLPVLLIHDFNRGRPPASARIFAQVQVFEPGTNGFTSLTNAPTLSSRAGISVRGSSTEGLPKASYRLEFRDEFENDKAVSVLGMPADGDWILYAPNAFEPVLVHNPFMHQLSRDIGRYSPRARFVEVYFVGAGNGLVQQSSYAGIYVMLERVEIGSHRVDAGTLAPQNVAPPSVTGGYLMKVDRLDPGDSGLFAANQSMGFVNPSESLLREPARAAQLNYIRNYMNGFGNALYDDARFMNPTNGYRAWIDTPSWIDHHLLNVLAFNVDALRLSAFFYKPRNGRLEFGPLWDFDRALGSTDGRDANPRVWRSAVGDLGTDFFNFTWWDRLFRDPDFFQAYIDRYQQLRGGAFATTNLWRLTDQLAAQVRAAQPRDSARWGVFPRGGYQAEVNLMKSWISNRADFMDRQFVAPPRLETPGGVVPPGFGAAIRPPPGLAVYYTLDGTDPRAPGGFTNPAAKRYGGTPVEIARNAKLVARTVNPAHVALTGPNNPPLRSIWSGPVSAVYVTDPIPLAVTEIHYHPDDDGAPGDADDLEFLELANIGDRPVPLAGLKLHGGVDLEWPAGDPRSIVPGARAVVVADTARFATRYPGVTNVVGSYAPKRLSNGGERLVLTGPLDEPVFDFSYRTEWQPLTDGGGFALVAADEARPGDPGLAAGWRRGSLPGGSPGRPDPPPRFTPALLTTGLLDNTAVRFRFLGTEGTSHRLEERSALVTGGWSPLAEFPGARTNRLETLDVPTTQAVRYFRLLRY